jgi:hypothetical protein
VRSVFFSLYTLTCKFYSHQWIFITDTVDAVYRPDNWFPEGMMDQLAEIAGNLPVGDSRVSPPFPLIILLIPPGLYQDTTADSGPAQFGINPWSSTDQRRRPLLNSLRQIDSIRDLVPFFSNVSISTYESVYASGGNVDWDAVERGLMDDMFDGR